MHPDSLANLLPVRRPLIVAVHLLLVPAAYFFAFALRFDFAVPPEYLAKFWATVPYLVAIRLLVFGRFGLYRGYWRHVGLRDLVDLGLAVTFSTALFVAALFATGELTRMPRSVLLLDWFMMTFLSGGLRFLARWIRESRPGFAAPAGRRTLVIGAGDAAERYLRQVLKDALHKNQFVGLVDDNPTRGGRSLHGVPVRGTTADLRRLTFEERVDLLVIAIPSATGERMRQIVERCRETDVEFKILPSLQDLLAGRAQIGQLREVQIEDLLGRDTVELDLQPVREDLAGRTVLVTGGAGSIGSELARQIARSGPARLVLLDRAESPLYFAHLAVAREYPDVEVVPVIASVTNGERLDQVFRTYRPDYVFHAAAYKHVPLMEGNTIEAIWNNVFGTQRTAECAARYGVRKFVLISTDKAVNPRSLMGATKRVAERIVLELPALRAAGTDFRAVRFGNVLGSDGSVIPLFRRQLAAGGPLTVTHPEVRRYFMTIPEAVQLVLQAAALPAAANRIAMLEMGRPVRILDLAEQIIRLSGLVPYRDIQIEITGLRPGEKLDEELTGEFESSIPTAAEKVRLIERQGADGAAVWQGLERLAASLTPGADAQLLQAIGLLVPEYEPWQAPETRSEPAVVRLARQRALVPLPLPLGTPPRVSDPAHA